MYEWNDGTDVLIHHGIKGQKWGLRRFQNPDGSLTAAGRARYGVEEAKKLINRPRGSIERPMRDELLMNTIIQIAILKRQV